METVLQLFKIDLSINHDMRDELFRSLLISCQKELETKGIEIDLSKVEDQMLLSDYAAWIYRKRNEDVGLSKNLDWRIKNRIIKGRANVK